MLLCPHLPQGASDRGASERWTSVSSGSSLFGDRVKIKIPCAGYGHGRERKARPWASLRCDFGAELLSALSFTR